MHPKQSWLALNAWSGWKRRYWGLSGGLSVTSLVFCGVAGLEPGLWASRACDHRDLKSMRAAYACCRAAGAPRGTVSWVATATLRWHGQGDGNATRVTTETKLGWLAKLRQAVERLREAEALPADPFDWKHLLSETGDIKWCWRCGARTEKEPRAVARSLCFCHCELSKSE